MVKGLRDLGWKEHVNDGEARTQAAQGGRGASSLEMWH